jgi:hypothetical protein
MSGLSMMQVENRKPAASSWFREAAGQGFEPQLPGPEPDSKTAPYCLSLASSTGSSHVLKAEGFAKWRSITGDSPGFGQKTRDFCPNAG